MHDSHIEKAVPGNHERFAKQDKPRLLNHAEVLCIAAMAIALYLINMHEAIDLPEIAHAILTVSKQ